MGNKGAFIRFEAPDMKPDIVTFSAVVSCYFSFTSILTSLSLFYAPPIALNYRQELCF